MIRTTARPFLGVIEAYGDEEEEEGYPRYGRIPEEGMDVAVGSANVTFSDVRSSGVSAGRSSL